MQEKLENEFNVTLEILTLFPLWTWYTIKVWKKYTSPLGRIGLSSKFQNMCLTFGRNSDVCFQQTNFVHTQ